MSGTKAGGQKTKRTIKAKYGDDYYVKLGAVGGKLSRTGGFYGDRERARIAGSKGGVVSGKRWTTARRAEASERMKAIRARYGERWS